jgi:uncharacterized protein YfaS (alpha-2-macroglobulin family)
MRAFGRALATLLLGSALAFQAAPGADERKARVEQFTPQGTVKQVRQVTARFSESMVPLGDPRVPSPFEVSCPEKGAGRWIDSRNWSYDFERDLAAGVRCSFRLKSGLRSIAGNAVTGPDRFAFSTGGPSLLRATPYEGSQFIDEAQAFALFLDAEPTEASLVTNVGFDVEHIPERIGIRLVTGKRRDDILKSFGYPIKKAEIVVVIEAKQAFPNGAHVSLVWGKGVATKSGVATDADQKIAYIVRSAFTAMFHCSRPKPKAPCIPVSPMSVDLSGEIASDTAKQITLTGPGGTRYEPEVPAIPERTTTRVVFRGPFPENAEFKIELPAALQDDAGRKLVNADRYPLAVKTGEFPPLAKFASRFGIVEWNGEAMLPVTLRNVEPEVAASLQAVTNESQSFGGKLAAAFDSVRGKVTRLSPDERTQILPWLHRVELARRNRSVFAAADAAGPAKPFTIPKRHGDRPFEVVGIPFDAPGLYVVELESPRLGAALLGTPDAMYVPTAALVTNLAVHFKWGRESSLAWVTSLDSGKPVKGASVAVQDCNGQVLWEGDTDRDGIARVPELAARDKLPSCPSKRENDEPFDYYDSAQTEALASIRAGLFVTARTANDLSFVGTGWDRGIEGWRFELPPESWLGPLTVHTIFDRPLYRAGETAHMKHVLRKKSLEGFSEIPQADRPKKLLVRHLGSDQKYDVPITWESGGVAETTWRIPKEAKLGSYDVVFTNGRSEWSAGEFRLEEFRVPLMRATVKPPSAPQVAVADMAIDLAVQFLAGGGAGGLPVTLRWQVRDRAAPQPEEFDGFVFGNGGVREGIERRDTEYESEERESAEGEGENGERNARVDKQKLALDAAGTARATIGGLPVADKVQEALVELEYRDPNGATQTAAATAALWPARWLVGVKPDSWVTTRDRLRADVAVVDPEGHPIANAPIELDVFEQTTYSNRTRLVGGFYAYEHVDETKRVGSLCSGTTNAKGVLRCDGKPPREGNLALVASVTDPDGKVSRSHAEVWVPGEKQWWFRATESDRIDLLPEKKRYEPGETARLQVRMPFDEATALVSLEREGVLAAWVTELSGHEPVVEIPIKELYAPNMFVSVMVVRGRIGDLAPTALVDLGKPAFKLGVAELRVGWKAFELKVSVSTAKTTYRVRDKAEVKVAVKAADGTPLAAESEVAIAAVDEGLLDLAPNTSWNLLDAMMGRRGYAIENATAQTQVVGKRHYGLKALPQGGGGGRGVTRELFDTLLYWSGRVKLDANGETSVAIPLNDSLTSFKIVAVATGGANRFGTGSTTIRSTQDLMLLSGIAPLVRAGDEIRNEFTVRNASDHTMQVAVEGTIEGGAALGKQDVALAAGEAKVIEWPVTAPDAIDELRYQVDAAAADTSDHLRVAQRVIPLVPVRTFQATLRRLEGETSEPVEMPEDAIPGKGGIRITLAAKLTKSLDGVREWMSFYPYGCMEQRVSRAIALRDSALWQVVTAAMPAHLDADGLLKYFPGMMWGSEVLSAYVLSISHAAGWALPETVESRVIEGLTGFVEGKVKRNSLLPTADLSIRKMAALEALSRVGKAEPKLLGSITIEANLWPTSAVLDWWSVLGRVASIPDRDRRLSEVEQIVGARLNVQGTTMTFATEDADRAWWLMASADTNAVRLVSILIEQNRWSEDLPRVLVAALGRQHGGTWCCTITNAWGVLAVEDFTKAFEATPVDGTTTAALAAATQSLAWKDAPEGAALSFDWPAGRKTLAIRHEGGGTPWTTIQALAAIPLKAPLSTGYKFERTVQPIEQRTKGRWSRGDLMRVRLEVEAQSDMSWVVVSDPVPAGASQLGSGLGGDSRLLTQGEESKGRAWPAFEERAADAYRAYYEFVPKGRFVFEHTLRLNQAGRFRLPATRVEALYAPEMLGEAPNEAIEVAP